MTDECASSVAEIVAKMRRDLEAIGGFENGMIGVPADGVRRYVEQLETALARPAEELPPGSCVGPAGTRCLMK